MRVSKLTLAIAAILGTGASSTIFALDLYVDTKSQQIFATPGPGRVHLGPSSKKTLGPRQLVPVSGLRRVPLSGLSRLKNRSQPT